MTGHASGAVIAAAVVLGAVLVSPFLPAELWVQIFGYVNDYWTLKSCALVNTHLHNSLQERKFDKILFRIPATFDVVVASTTLSAAISERNIKLHPFLTLHVYSWVTLPVDQGSTQPNNSEWQNFDDERSEFYSVSGVQKSKGSLDTCPKRR